MLRQVSPARTNGQLDRRQRKTRAALQQALLELVAEKPYRSITVEDIAARADVARATFYAHYADKNTLLLETVNALLADLADQTRTVAPQDRLVFTGAAFDVVFAHAEAHRDLYRLLLTGEGGREARALAVESFRSLVTEVFSRVVAAQKTTPRFPMAAIVTGFVGASLLTIEALVLGELEGSADERIRVLVQSQAYGIAWALGFEPGTFEYVEEAPAAP